MGAREKAAEGAALHDASRTQGATIVRASVLGVRPALWRFGRTYAINSKTERTENRPLTKPATAKS